MDFNTDIFSLDKPSKVRKQVVKNAHEEKKSFLKNNLPAPMRISVSLNPLARNTVRVVKLCGTVTLKYENAQIGTFLTDCCANAHFILT